VGSPINRRDEKGKREPRIQTAEKSIMNCTEKKCSGEQTTFAFEGPSKEGGRRFHEEKKVGSRKGRRSTGSQRRTKVVRTSQETSEKVGRNVRVRTRLRMEGDERRPVGGRKREEAEGLICVYKRASRRLEGRGG